MSDRLPEQTITTSASRPTPTVEFRIEPVLADTVACALLTLLQRSPATNSQGPAESTNA